MANHIYDCGCTVRATVMPCTMPLVRKTTTCAFHAADHAGLSAQDRYHRLHQEQLHHVGARDAVAALVPNLAAFMDLVVSTRDFSLKTLALAVPINGGGAAALSTLVTAAATNFAARHDAWRNGVLAARADPNLSAKIAYEVNRAHFGVDPTCPGGAEWTKTWRQTVVRPGVRASREWSMLTQAQRDAAEALWADEDADADHEIATLDGYAAALAAGTLVTPPATPPAPLTISATTTGLPVFDDYRRVNRDEHLRRVVSNLKSIVAVLVNKGVVTAGQAAALADVGA